MFVDAIDPKRGPLDPVEQVVGFKPFDVGMGSQSYGSSAKAAGADNHWDISLVPSLLSQNMKNDRHKNSREMNHDYFAHKCWAEKVDTILLLIFMYSIISLINEK